MTGDLFAVGTVMPEWRFGPITQDDIIRYAEASGDDNPIHVDAEAARAIGLPGAVVQGMLMMGYADQALAHWFPDGRIGKISCRFALPLLADDTLAISARVVQASHSDREMTLMLRLILRNSAAKVVAMAEAAVTL
jgi:acyl dehydratase